jgi:hypothetical protein
VTGKRDFRSQLQNIRKLIASGLTLIASAFVITVVVIVVANSNKLETFDSCQDTVQILCAGDGLLRPTKCYLKGAYSCFQLAVWPQKALEQLLQPPSHPPPISPTASENPGAFSSPVAGPPAISPTGIPTAPPGKTAVDRLGRALNDTEVVDAAGAVIGMVHEGRPVHIIGLDGGRLRIRMHDGQEGFVRADSVADTGEWIGSVPERTGSP